MLTLMRGTAYLTFFCCAMCGSRSQENNGTLVIKEVNETSTANPDGRIDGTLLEQLEIIHSQNANEAPVKQIGKTPQVEQDNGPELDLLEKLSNETHPHVNNETLTRPINETLGVELNDEIDQAILQPPEPLEIEDLVDMSSEELNETLIERVNETELEQSNHTLIGIMGNDNFHKTVKRIVELKIDEVSPSKWCYTIINPGERKMSRYEAESWCSRSAGSSLPILAADSPHAPAEFHFWTKFLNESYPAAWTPYEDEDGDNKRFVYKGRSGSGSVLLASSNLWLAKQPESKEDKCVIVSRDKGSGNIGFDDVFCRYIDVRLAVCQRRRGCERVPKVDNATSDATVPFGERVKYTCDEGLEMDEQTTVTCTCAGIHITGPPPRCVAKSTATKKATGTLIAFSSAILTMVLVVFVV